MELIESTATRSTIFNYTEQRYNLYSVGSTFLRFGSYHYVTARRMRPDLRSGNSEYFEVFFIPAVRP